MTLIIGVRCGDGVVIGSDSVTTYASPDGQRTIEQETETKIRLINNVALYASAGDVGPSQDVLSALESNWRTITKRARYHAVKKSIADTISGQIKNYARRMEETLVVPNRNSSNFVTRVGIESLMALPIGDEHHLFRFDEHGNPEEYVTEIPIVSIGSGQRPADPFLAFVKKVAWNDEQPDTVKQGIVGVLWTLLHVIETNAAPGVGGKASIGVLEKADGSWKSSVLIGDRLGLYTDAIESAEESLYELLNKPGTSTPPPRFDTQNDN